MVAVDVPAETIDIRTFMEPKQQPPAKGSYNYKQNKANREKDFPSMVKDEEPSYAYIKERSEPNMMWNGKRSGLQPEEAKKKKPPSWETK